MGFQKGILGNFARVYLQGTKKNGIGVTFGNKMRMFIEFFGLYVGFSGWKYGVYYRFGLLAGW